MSKFVCEFGSRSSRMFNVAVGVVDAFRRGGDLSYHGRNFITCAGLRDRIRGGLGLEKLCGEEKNGDMRAHGDACGGHGLHLRMVSHKFCGKMIVLNEDNLRRCLDYVARVEPSLV
jgi:hypothetical protein